MDRQRINAGGSRLLVPGDQQVFDVCIVGTGPAGIVCCLELAKRRPDFRILLLEYGAAAPGDNSLDRSIEVLNLVNHHPPAECTNKGLGGSSATWGGRCVTYDEIDFLDRPVIAGQCTWNLDFFNCVKGYYAAAADYMECGAPLFTIEECFPGQASRISQNYKAGDISDSCLERWSMPTRFGDRYREELAAAKNVELVQPFEVASIVGSPGAEDVRISGRVPDSSETRTYTAKKLVLAAGAQESTRLLLRNPNLFGKSEQIPKQLGLYYQGHISGKIASIVFTGDPKATDFGFLKDGEIYVRRRFQFSTTLLQKENLLSTALWLDNPLYSDPSHRSGTMSFIYLMMRLPVIGRRLAPPAIAHSITKGTQARLSLHFGNILRGFPKSFLEPASIFMRRYLAKRKLPGVFLYSPDNSYALHFHAEQVPVEENRMFLAEDGVTLKIAYGYVDADVDSVIRTHRILDEWLRKTGAGRLDYWYPEAELAERVRNQSKDGLHQVGTTRMSLTADDGVVNPDMQLWNNDRVYLCSSSVFPTSSQANPTFFLAACAARLAAHLAS